MIKELEALKEIFDGRTMTQKEYMFFEQLVKFNEHMKPIFDKEGNHRCPRCFHRVDSHYCSECGGALDWEDK